MKKARFWLKGAIKKPGVLRKRLKVKTGHTIPIAKLRRAASGKLGPKTAQRARLALRMRGFKHK